MSKIPLLIFAALAAYVGYTTVTNTKSMNNMIEKGIEITKKDFPLEELEIGELKKY